MRRLPGLIMTTAPADRLGHPAGHGRRARRGGQGLSGLGAGARIALAAPVLAGVWVLTALVTGWAS